MFGPVSSLRVFVAIFLGDLIVRTAYLTGKSPVLPVFAEQLGADAVLLGFIVSISAVTGLFCKPVIGFLNDRTGAWLWISLGTALFVTMPWAYGWIENPGDLVKVRLVHGLATAIYGPVTLAMLTGTFSRRRAEVYGWFGLARTGAGMAGPFLGGLLLTLLDPGQIYAVTGLIAALSLLPLLYLRLWTDTFQRAKPRQTLPFRQAIRRAIRAVSTNRSLLVFSTVEMNLYIGIYALKTFFPILLLSSGRSFLEIGLFLSIQEAISALLRPLCGTLAERFGYRRMIFFGLIAVGSGLALVPILLTTRFDVLVALTVGLGHAAFVPAAMALMAQTIQSDHRGTAFGVLGSIRNLGKVTGPVIGGVLIASVGHSATFAVLAMIPISVAGLMMLRSKPALLNRHTE